LAHVLIVDDDDLIARMFSDWLHAVGFRTVRAATGTQALDLVSRSRPDLILLDLNLPDIGGLAVCRILKDHERTHRIPVVVITASDRPEDKSHALDLGVEDFVNKPVNPKELVARVQALIRSSELSGRLLQAYTHMDELGEFADHYAQEIAADLKPTEVAWHVARQLLGTQPGDSRRPGFVWGGAASKGRVRGLGFWHHEGTIVSSSTVSSWQEVDGALAPFRTEEGQYLSNAPLPLGLRSLLGAPPEFPLANFAAVRVGDDLVLAADYRQQVTPYEFPLLRSSLRSWTVLQRIWREMRRTEGAFVFLMEALALAAEFQDDGVASHIRRVNAYAKSLAQSVGCDPAFIRRIAVCAQMHDVGKITMPASILQKPGLLSPNEWEIIKRHTVNGARILKGPPELAMAAHIARSHHENYDGTGYPDGTAGDEIPLEARIVKIVDIYDALRTRRSYKPSFSHEAAVKVLRLGDDRVIPSHLDPLLLEAFLDRQTDFQEIYEREPVPPAAAG
jgi:putative nucleotidyltransferase with HDIG domain